MGRWREETGLATHPRPHSPQRAVPQRGAPGLAVRGTVPTGQGRQGWGSPGAEEEHTEGCLWWARVRTHKGGNGHGLSTRQPTLSHRTSWSSQQPSSCGWRGGPGGSCLPVPSRAPQSPGCSLSEGLLETTATCGSAQVWLAGNAASGGAGQCPWKQAGLWGCGAQAGAWILEPGPTFHLGSLSARCTSQDRWNIGHTSQPPNPQFWLMWLLVWGKETGCLPSTLPLC